MNIQDFYLIQTSLLKRIGSRQALMLVPLHFRTVESFQTLKTFATGIDASFPETKASILYSKWGYVPGVLPLILPMPSEASAKTYLLTRTSDSSLTVNPDIQKLIQDSVYDAYALYMENPNMQAQVMSREPSEVIASILDALLTSMHSDARVDVSAEQTIKGWHGFRIKIENYLSKKIFGSKNEGVYHGA